MKRVDAVVIGAGAGGGIVAKELATSGLSVVLLERGRWYGPTTTARTICATSALSILGNDSVRTTKATRGSLWTCRAASASSLAEPGRL